MKSEAQLRAAVPADLPAIRALLAGAGLPMDDLGRAAVSFVVAECGGGEVVGTAGAEKLAPQLALLRSFAVAPSCRRQGIAGAMLARLLADGAASGVTEFYLLTVTATPFFAARGFAVVPRERAPVLVREHAQYKGLCPASATLMQCTVAMERP